jgi:hypothetical protein
VVPQIKRNGRFAFDENTITDTMLFGKLYGTFGRPRLLAKRGKILAIIRAESPV